MFNEEYLLDITKKPPETFFGKDCTILCKIKENVDQ